jgi:hypothetical protein
VNFGLFAPTITPDACPYCGAAVLDCRTDTGFPMRAEPVNDGPYVLVDGTLYFLSNDGFMLLQGHAHRKHRKVPSDEQQWGSHFHSCSKRGEWSAPK